MSLILDALRKSEAERRRGKSPDLFASLPAPVAARRIELLRLWPWFALVALALAAASVYWIARQADAPEPVESAQRDMAEDRRADVPASRQASAAPASTLATTPARTPASAPAVAPTQPAPGPPTVPAKALGMPPLAALPAATPSTVTAPPAPTPAADNQLEPLPPIAALTASERASLPPLKLSMHVWDSEPARRFAIIDGQRIGEGAMVGNGVVEEIRRDGVVIDIDGRRILLPRP